MSGSPPTQTVRFRAGSDRTAHSSTIPFQEGFPLDWEDSLCRHMVEDEVVLETAVGTRYGHVDV